MRIGFEKLILATLFPIMLGGLFCAFPPIHELEILNLNENIKMRRGKIISGDTFSLRYINSLYRVPQIEYFKIDDQYRIVVMKQAFGSLEAAAYYDPNPQSGLYFNRLNKMYEIDDINVVIDPLRLRIGYTTNQVLNIWNERIVLLNIGKAGEVLLFRIKKKSLMGHCLEKIWNNL
jgi:hypothetical protein